jgi:hypothetical protein
VIEAIRRQLLRVQYAEELIKNGANEMVLRRISHVFDATRFASRISSICVYRGKEMPMCSVLCCAEFTGKPSYVQVEPGDFELAVVCPDPAALYDCPQERIEALRRRFAALKASLTRQQKQATPLLESAIR